ncbi:MAG: hypothetical protein RIF41_20495 [Polyangiaceae bacterium]
MKYAALLALLLPTLTACGAPPPRPPTVTVGDSPAEIDPPDPAPDLPVVSPVDDIPLDEGVGAPQQAASRQGLLLTDGEGHRFSVETIRTISPPATR